MQYIKIKAFLRFAKNGVKRMLCEGLYNKFTDKNGNLLEMVCVVWLLAVSLPVQAGEFMRCGSNHIVPGNTKLDVLKKCGEPDYIEVISSVIERGWKNGITIRALRVFHEF